MIVAPTIDNERQNTDWTLTDDVHNITERERTQRHELGLNTTERSDTEFALFDFDSYSEYYNWRRGMELCTIESLNLHSHLSEIEECVERLELWYSLWQNGKQEQSILFLTVGGKEMYSLLKNLTFPDNLAKLAFPMLKQLLLAHVIPVDFQASERAKFNSLNVTINDKVYEDINNASRQWAQPTSSDTENVAFIRIRSE
ncbi:unnamed protein product [Echinostoma caproni]|uniref:DHC_N2 domain-containing protein n=1 Tax=Echinostoma caproni TaxID=27848 RepID=A0A183ALR9_9TREM|nr:unnamed protein product [Echinostoma caproni]